MHAMPDKNLDSKKFSSYTPLFIAGAPRSGTSLLCRLLDWNPSVLSFPRELPLLALFYDQSDGIDLAKYFNEGFVEDERGKQAMFFHQSAQPIERKKLSGKLGLDIPIWPDARLFRKTYLEEIKKSSGNLFADVIAALGQATIESVQGAKGVYVEHPEYFVLKTPLITERYAVQIASDIHGSKFIHILRDPVSRYVSEKTMMLRLGGVPLAEGFLARSVDDWNESVSLAMSNKAKIGADRYKIVSYEDLVAKPEEVMRNIAAFLGIAYEEGLVNPTYLGLPIKANSSFENKSYGINRASAKHIARKDGLIPLQEQIKLIWKFFSCQDSIVFYLSNARRANLHWAIRIMYLISHAQVGVSRLISLLTRRL